MLFNIYFIWVSFCLFKRQIGRIQDDTAVFLEELLINSDGTRVGTKAFNGKNLTKLYERLAGKEGASYDDVRLAALDTTADTTGIGLKSGKTSKQLREYENNLNKDTIVTIGSKKWVVTSLTVDENGDVIATMWEHDADESIKWNTWKSSSLSTTYPTSIYGTSYVRAKILNGIGEDESSNQIDVKYNSNSSTMSDIAKADNYSYSMFTDKTSSGNITEFIVKPKDVKYHETERAVVLCPGTIVYSALNESTKYHSINWNNSGTNGTNVRDAQNKLHYFDWKNDYIWLPSLCEVGSGSSYKGIWGMDATARKSSNISWLRSGATDTAIHAWILEANGSAYWAEVDQSATSIVARPAFHFNLTKAEAASVKYLSSPKELQATYNGEQQEVKDAEDIKDAKWFDSSVFNDATKIKIEYLDATGAVMASKPKEAATYTVRYTILNKDYFCWLDGSSKDDTVRSSTFKIKPKELEFPKFYNDVNEKVYNGGKNINFIVSTYDKAGLNITYDGSEIAANNTISVTEAGEYQLEVSLKDNKNYKLLSAQTKLTFKVSRRILK